MSTLNSSAICIWTNSDCQLWSIKTFTWLSDSEPSSDCSVSALFFTLQWINAMNKRRIMLLDPGQSNAPLLQIILLVVQSLLHQRNLYLWVIMIITSGPINFLFPYQKSLSYSCDAACNASLTFVHSDVIYNFWCLHNIISLILVNVRLVIIIKTYSKSVLCSRIEQAQWTALPLSNA